MIKFIMVLLFLCYSFFGVGQTPKKDYRQYFQLASYANYKLKTGSPNDYSNILKSLATEYKQYPFDYAKLGAMLLESDTSQALFYMRLAIAKGFSLTSLQYKIEKEEDKVFIKENLQGVYNEFLKKRNNVFVTFLDSLIETDQRYRAETFDLPDSIRFMKQDSIDRVNLLMLKAKIEQYGWPSYSMVGHDYAGVAFVIVLHGTRQFSPESEVFHFFKSLLWKELKKGGTLVLFHFPIGWINTMLFIKKKNNHMELWQMLKEYSIQLKTLKNATKIDFQSV